MRSIKVSEIKNGDVLVERDGQFVGTLYACSDAQPSIENGEIIGWVCHARRSNDPGDVAVLFARNGFEHYGPKLQLQRRVLEPFEP